MNKQFNLTDEARKGIIDADNVLNRLTDAPAGFYPVALCLGDGTISRKESKWKDNSFYAIPVPDQQKGDKKPSTAVLICAPQIDRAVGHANLPTILINGELNEKCIFRIEDGKLSFYAFADDKAMAFYQAQMQKWEGKQVVAPVDVP